MDAEVRRRAEECVTGILNELDSDMLNWRVTLEAGIRAVEHLVADAVAQAVKEERERLYERMGPVLRYVQGMVTADGAGCECELCLAWTALCADDETEK